MTHAAELALLAADQELSAPRREAAQWALDEIERRDPGKLTGSLAWYFDCMAADREAMASNGIARRNNGIEAKVWRRAANHMRDMKPKGGAK